MIYEFRNVITYTFGKKVILNPHSPIVVVRAYHADLLFYVSGVDRVKGVSFNTPEDADKALEEVNLYLSYDKDKNPEKFI